MKFSLKNCNFFIISLKGDEEKFERTVERVVELGIDRNKIRKVNGVKKEQHHIGILHSHINAISQGLEAGDPFIVLEDDISINNRAVEIEIPDNTDSLYLGISSWGFKNSPPNFAQHPFILADNISGFDSVKRIKNMLSAHAICYINKQYTKDLLELLNSSLTGNTYYGKTNNQILYFGNKIVPCDVTMANNQPFSNVMGMRNPIFYQAGKHEYCTLIKI